MVRPGGGRMSDTDLIGQLAGAGATVLMSSHRLSEVEQTRTQVVVMDRGRVAAEGKVSDIIGAAGPVYVKVDDRDRARRTPIHKT